MKKKLLLTLVALFSVLGGAMAQGTMLLSKGTDALSAFSETSGYYVIAGIAQNNSTDKFLYDNGTKVQGKAITDAQVGSSSGAQFVWKITKNGEKYNVQNVATGKYVSIPTSNGGAVSMVNNPVDLSINFTDALACINNGSHAIDVNSDGMNVVTWAGTTAASNQGSRRLMIYEANVEDYSYFTCDNVYRMKLREGGSPANYYFKYNGTGVDTRNNTDADAFAPERLFFLKQVAGEYGAYTLHCVKLGESVGFSVGVNGANAAFTSTPTKFYVSKNSNGGFNLRHNEGVNSHMNDVNGALGVWNSGSSLNDKGSMITISDITDADIDASAGDDAAKAAAKSAHTYTNVEKLFLDDIHFTLTDASGANYVGDVQGIVGTAPTFLGAYGYTLTNEAWNETNYSATITFPFPVNTATGIQSALGTSKWYVDADDKVLAHNEANTPVIYSTNADSFRWIIIPSCTNDGTFSFKIKSVGADKYIPADASTESGTATTLVEEASAGSFYYSHILTGEGFATELANNKFLTINSGTKTEAQNIWIWPFNGTAGHTGSNLTFPEITDNDEAVIEAFSAISALEKFTLEDGATVVGPTEFAAPAQINAAIDAIASVEDNIEAKAAFLSSENGTKLTTYKNALSSYGTLDNVVVNMKSIYGTLILSCPSSAVDGLTKYTCSSDNNGVLELSESTGGYAQFVPYIIKKTGSQSKFQIIGWNKGQNHENVTAGYLTGVLQADTKVPSGSYILATLEGVQAFYKVETSNYTAAVNKCYITMPSASDVKALYFDENGVETAIENLDAEHENGAIFNLAGQKLNGLRKGVNIVNGKKILVK